MSTKISWGRMVKTLGYGTTLKFVCQIVRFNRRCQIACGAKFFFMSNCPILSLHQSLSPGVDCQGALEAARRFTDHQVLHTGYRSIINIICINLVNIIYNINISMGMLTHRG